MSLSSLESAVGAGVSLIGVELSPITEGLASSRTATLLQDVKRDLSTL